MWWNYHCYRPVGSMAVLSDYAGMVQGMATGQTVLVIATDHGDSRQYYGVLDPLNPVEDDDRYPHGTGNRHTVLAGYERFTFKWVRADYLIFLEAP